MESGPELGVSSARAEVRNGLRSVGLCVALFWLSHAAARKRNQGSCNEHGNGRDGIFNDSTVVYWN